ncbi:unnamed protein product [Nippostrongylus brasiliensis]|uniref:Cystatin domain-containing protein n=1 Tax=Nippostrongylus brasiliensis TaxID=27835 RepID=A0A0N4Y7U7_NIPBR|nr:unnamed protein product [Nippostrongylus brasiliensis]
MNALLAGTALLFIYSAFAAPMEECTRGFIDRYPASENDDLALDIEDHFGYHVDYTDIITTFDAKHDGKHEVFVKVDKRKKKKAMNFFFKYELLDNEDGPFEKIEQMEFRKYRRCREAIHGPK